MQGKHGKNRNPLTMTPRAAGAVLGLAAFGVIAGTAQASIFDSDSAKSAAAVATVPDRSKAETSENSEKAENAENAEKKGSDAKASDSGTTDSKTRRDKVIELARTWRPGTADRVPYSQTRSHEGYRTDCSGYVAMTLGLARPGPNTVGLTSSRYTERITMSQLKKGDLVMDAEGTNTTRHVVIFEKWANDDRTSYWAFEQRGRYGTDHRTRSYGLDEGSEYKAYRPKNL